PHLPVAHRALPPFPTRRSSDLTPSLTSPIRSSKLPPPGAPAISFRHPPIVRMTNTYIAGALPVGRSPIAAAVSRECSRHTRIPRSEEHTSELQSRFDLVCRLLL